MPVPRPVEFLIQLLVGFLVQIDDHSLIGRHDNGFTNLRRAAELALVPEADLAARLTGAGEAVSRFALTLRGWGEERRCAAKNRRDAAVRLWKTPQRGGGRGPKTTAAALWGCGRGKL
jgi:hypothetical protein